MRQVAATLAATLVTHDTIGASGQRLLDDRMLNVVLALVLVTSILRPVLTERFAPHLASVNVHPEIKSAKGGQRTSTPKAPRPMIICVSCPYHAINCDDPYEHNLQPESSGDPAMG